MTEVTAKCHLEVKLLTKYPAQRLISLRASGSVLTTPSWAMRGTKVILSNTHDSAEGFEDVR